MGICFGKPRAYALVRGRGDWAGVKGVVRFYQRPGGILVEAKISGLPNNKSGFHGFHIHTGDSCGGTDFSDTGSHYNPTDQPHPLHAGDLPPLMSAGGNAYLAVVTDRFSIRDILGRTVVIHAEADDLHTQPAGDSGNKIACGVIVR